MKLVSVTPCLELWASELFEDEQFVEWLNNPDTNIATWHREGKSWSPDGSNWGAPHGRSDVFIWYSAGLDDNGQVEGGGNHSPRHVAICEMVAELKPGLAAYASDAALQAMPAHCWDVLMSAIPAEFTEGVIWLQNLKWDDDEEDAQLPRGLTLDGRKKAALPTREMEAFTQKFLMDNPDAQPGGDEWE